jgi:hypothetical protein
MSAKNANIPDNGVQLSREDYNEDTATVWVSPLPSHVLTMVLRAIVFVNAHLQTHRLGFSDLIV